MAVGRAWEKARPRSYYFATPSINFRFQQNLALKICTFMTAHAYLSCNESFDQSCYINQNDNFFYIFLELYFVNEIGAQTLSSELKLSLQ